MKVSIEQNKSGKFVGKVDGKTVATRDKRETVARYIKANFGVDCFAAAAEVQTVACDKKSEFHINKRFQFVEHFTTMIAKKKANALVVSGPGGLGKTHTIMETLKRNGLKEDTIGSLESDFISIKGFTTPKMLFRTLWENNGKVIVFDDCDSAFKDPVAANLLKGALDSSETRVISWNAEFSEREDMPNRFEFFGRVIFISNYSMDKIPQALQSRALRVSLDMTTDEKIDRIEHIMGEVKADAKDKADVVKLIRKLAHKATDLNMRECLKALQIRQSTESDEMFQELATYSLTA